MDQSFEVRHPGIRARAPPGGRASSPGGSCGPVASLGMVIRRYLVPRGRGHTPQVVVGPLDAADVIKGVIDQGLRPRRALSEADRREGPELRISEKS